MDGRRDRGARGPEAGKIVGRCPACGPLAVAETSRYCADHLAELRARWRAIRAPNSTRQAA